MKKIFNRLIDLMHFPRTDRLLHFFWGTLIFIFISIFFSREIALISTIIFAFLKEVYDYFKENSTGFDVVDAFYTILAPILIYIIF